jgi:hypothetical protein
MACSGVHPSACTLLLPLASPHKPHTAYISAVAAVVSIVIINKSPILPCQQTLGGGRGRMLVQHTHTHVAQTA